MQQNSISQKTWFCLVRYNLWIILIMDKWKRKWIFFQAILSSIKCLFGRKWSAANWYCMQCVCTLHFIKLLIILESLWVKFSFVHIKTVIDLVKYRFCHVNVFIFSLSILYLYWIQKNANILYLCTFVSYFFCPFVSGRRYTLTYGSETPPISIAGSSVAWIIFTIRVWVLKSYRNSNWTFPKYSESKTKQISVGFGYNHPIRLMFSLAYIYCLKP